MLVLFRMLGEVNLLAHLSNAGLRHRHLSGVMERRKALSLRSVDGNQAAGDCLRTVLNVDWKTMETKGTSREPLSQIDF